MIILIALVVVWLIAGIKAVKMRNKRWEKRYGESTFSSQEKLFLNVLGTLCGIIGFWLELGED